MKRQLRSMVSVGLCLAGCIMQGHAQAATNLVILGAPGSGKGTLASQLEKDLQLCHVSTGDIVRAEIAAKSEFGKQITAETQAGNLLADGSASMTKLLSLVKERLASKPCEAGFMLDGFPRTLWQAEELDKMLASMNKKLDAAVLLQVKEETVLNRLKDRLTCKNKQCGHTFHAKLNAPKVKGKCDACGGELVQRVDDQEKSVIQKRFQTYLAKTVPVFEYYKAQKVLLEIDGEAAPGQVVAATKSELARLKAAAAAAANVAVASKPAKA